MSVRTVQGKRGWAVNFAVVTIKPTLLAATSRTWIDGEKIPASGGALIVANHVSHLDPLLTAYFVYDHGRIPRYLAKSGLFRTKFVGTILTSADQIPVERLSRDAVGAYAAAVKAVNDGECVVVYPEGTLTRDPDLWPMTGKSGAARIALATGAPVIPVGHWGVQDILYPYASRPHLFPRKHVTMKAGDPVALDDLRALPHTPQVVSEATERIMAALTDIVAELRDEPAPAERFDPRKAGVRQTGDPHEEEGPPMTKIAVFSAGSWGTAFSVVLGDAGNDVTLWARREEVVEAINGRRENTEYLPGIELPGVRHGHRRRRGGRCGRRHRRADRALPEPAREPHDVGADDPREGHDGVLDEGRRARAR